MLQGVVGARLPDDQIGRFGKHILGKAGDHFLDIVASDAPVADADVRMGEAQFQLGGQLGWIGLTGLGCAIALGGGRADGDHLERPMAVQRRHRPWQRPISQKDFGADAATAIVHRLQGHRHGHHGGDGEGNGGESRDTPTPRAGPTDANRSSISLRSHRWS